MLLSIMASAAEHDGEELVVVRVKAVKLLQIKKRENR